MPNTPEPLPNPFKTKEDAEGAFEAFIGQLHSMIDDDLTDFVTNFTSRMHPELAESMQRMMLTDEGGGSIDAMEESPEYQLYFAHESDVISALLRRLVEDYSPNVYGSVQYRIHQRERALIGAP